MGPTTTRPVVAPLERALALVAGLLLAAYVVWTVPGVRPDVGFSVLFDGVLQGSAYAVVAVLALALVRHRLPGAGLATAVVVLRCLGFVVELTFAVLGHPLGFPSVADAAWCLSALTLIAALSLRLRELAPRLPRLVLLDGTTSALLVLGVVSAVLAGPVRTLVATATERSAVVVNLAYPLLDVVVLTLVGTLVATATRRLHRADLLLVAGAVGITVVDIVYLVLLTRGDWRPGTMLGSLSLAATVALVAALVAALTDPPRPGPRRTRRVGDRLHFTPTPGVAVPATLTAAAFVLLTVSSRTDQPLVSPLAYAAAGLMSLARGLLTLGAERVEAGVMVGAASQDLLRFQALVEGSQDFIGIADLDGRTLYINPAGRRMAGLGPEADVTALAISDLRPPGRREEWEEVRLPALMARGWWEGESEIAPLDGRTLTIPVAVSTFLVHHPVTHEPYAIASIQRDIRERRRAANAMRDLADQRALLVGRLVEAQEEERTRIAADVHDDSVQALAAVELRLRVLRDRTREEAPDLVAQLDALLDIVTAATARLRTLLFDLESPARSARLAEAIASAATFVFDDTPITWTIEGDLEVELPETERVTAYRIVKEALTNVRRHAAAGHVEVLLRRRDGGIEVVVDDDGRGIAPGDDERRPGHLGLAGMRDRATVAGGRLEVTSTGPRGTRVSLWLPAPVAETAPRS